MRVQLAKLPELQRKLDELFGAGTITKTAHVMGTAYVTQQAQQHAKRQLTTEKASLYRRLAYNEISFSEWRERLRAVEKALEELEICRKGGTKGEIR